MFNLSLNVGGESLGCLPPAVQNPVKKHVLLFKSRGRVAGLPPAVQSPVKKRPLGPELPEWPYINLLTK